MHTKGTFFIGRKSYICEAFGEARWDAFLTRLAAADPVFARPILATTLVPSESYTRFQDALVKEFFDGDEQGYWITGEKAGEWALTEGPYKAFRAAGMEKLPLLVANLPKIWDAYFDDARLVATLKDGAVDVRIEGLPVSHISLELTVMGFGEKAIELCTGKTPRTERLTGVKSGHKDIHYRFYV